MTIFSMRRYSRKSQVFYQDVKYVFWIRRNLTQPQIIDVEKSIKAWVFSSLEKQFVSLTGFPYAEKRIQTVTRNNFLELFLPKHSTLLTFVFANNHLFPLARTRKERIFYLLLQYI